MVISSAGVRGEPPPLRYGWWYATTGRRPGARCLPDTRDKREKIGRGTIAACPTIPRRLRSSAITPAAARLPAPGAAGAPGDGEPDGEGETSGGDDRRVTRIIATPWRRSRRGGRGRG